MDGEKTTKNMITQKDFFKVCMWFGNHQEMLIANAPLKSELAKTISQELGFNVGPGAIKRAIEASGVKYNPRLLTGFSAHSKLRGRVEKLEKEVQKLTADGAWLLGIVREMAAALGHPIKGDIIA